MNAAAPIDKPNKKKEFNPMMAYLMLTVITLIRGTSYWHQKSLGYFYGFKGQGEQLGNPMYEVSSAYGMMDDYYGFLVGLFYTMPYAISGLYAGNRTRFGNRKDRLFAIIMCLGCFQLGTGMLDSFLFFGLFRILHGAVSAGINPFCYSLVSDIFPPERRTTANSLLSVAQFFGISLSSLSILFIKRFGWRWTYII